MRKKKWYKSGCFIGFAGFMICVSLLCSAVFGWHLYTQHRMHKAELLIAGYLKDKYHEDFIVLDGKYIWATGSYSFTASPKSDIYCTFPVFISGIYKSGIGDMYGLVQKGRRAHKMLDPFVNSISENNFYGVGFGPTMHGSHPKWEVIMSDIHRNKLSPLQATAKYPKEIYLFCTINYAYDITDKSKIRVFYDVYKLVKFLKKNNFGEIKICMGFYPEKMFTKKSIKEVYHEKSGNFKSKNWRHLTYRINIRTSDLVNIKSWRDIRNYADKKEGKPEDVIWIKDLGK